MGREQLEALMKVLQRQLELGSASPALGTWDIRFDKERNAFYFDKCEFGGYCEERPAVISLEGEVLDPGGPLLG
ncbi:MAG TPA: hypothetical protein VFA70_14070 [Dehalococcoidia bacterium]|jgi:hypothetical protein|nr:hypothetical protein [Dehalococcoidia bacterium]